MTMTFKALIWAGIIIATAFYLNGIGMSQGASWGITSGLAGAAWGSIYGGHRPCAGECA
ncbi:hypothetical protein [uncultured Erythrobacter sp.]|uniref:hypothetical protein n=1 Tax=uncultured Erythrobacter sp. TaxID=263913 RepID=UPI0026280797|nr:hypothetical protein [uncultured Erythrobacter sp.]